MYKVFFNGRIVFVNSTIDKKSLPAQQIFNVDEAQQIAEIWQVFIENEDLKEIHLFPINDINLMQVFISNFKVIEAAGGLVFNEREELLCIYRLNHWDFPKGKIEKNEAPERAAQREVEEETGITGVKIVDYTDTTYHIYPTPKEKNGWIFKPTYWYLMKYTGDEPLRPQHEENIQEARWIKKDEIARLVPQSYASLKDLFQFAVSLPRV